MVRSVMPLCLSAKDPIETAATLVPKLRREAGLVIVLSHLDEQQNERLADEVPGITAILGGRTYAPSESAWVAPRTGTIVTYPGAQGEYLGVLRLDVDADGKTTRNE